MESQEDLGGYSVGTAKLQKGDVLNVVVGGAGCVDSLNGGYNGGGGGAYGCAAGNGTAASSGGGGGSGYLNTSLGLTDASTENGKRSGNGMAKITLNL